MVIVFIVKLNLWWCLGVFSYMWILEFVLVYNEIFGKLINVKVSIIMVFDCIYSLLGWVNVLILFSVII